MYEKTRTIEVEEFNKIIIFVLFLEILRNPNENVTMYQQNALSNVAVLSRQKTATVETRQEAQDVNAQSCLASEVSIRIKFQTQNLNTTIRHPVKLRPRLKNTVYELSDELKKIEAESPDHNESAFLITAFFLLYAVILLLPTAFSLTFLCV